MSAPVTITVNRGDQVNIDWEYSVEGSSPAVYVDPTTVKVQVKAPGGAITEYSYGGGGTVVRRALGKYRQTIDADTSGDWFYRPFSEGNNKAGSTPGKIVVLDDDFD